MSKKLLLGSMLLLGLVLAACTSTKIKSNHPLIQGSPGQPVAKVYFIRPRTERTMGVADNTITIELDHQPVLELVKAEYTLIELKPGPVELTVKSMTIWGPHSKMKAMEKSRMFEFEDGQTYFVSFTLVNGEFRGIYFQPETVDLLTAKELTRYLRPIGEAKKAPIKSIDS